MNDELARRHAETLRETLGDPGRLIALSKTGYSDRHPLHAPIFNANVCLQAGKIWWGDLDLTLDEPKLITLASRLGETVFVLAERHARFKQEQSPLLESAVYSVTAGGHTCFSHDWIERTQNGSLHRRPPERR